MSDLPMPSYYDMPVDDSSYREVCRKAWGDFPKNYEVHHIDGVDTNNNPENLIAVSKAFHAWLHKNQSVYKALSYRGLFNRAVMDELLKYYKKNRHLYFFIAVMELYRKGKLAKRKIDTTAWVSNEKLVQEYAAKYGSGDNKPTEPDDSTGNSQPW